MRILHTSDWHIGKRLENKTRIEEQRAVLEDISKIVKEKNVDVVCVSGDVYDTYTPSAESEKLFYDTIYSLTSLGAVVIVISGNHDDPTRLSASKSIALLNGVYFAGVETSDILENPSESQNDNCKVKLISSGEDYFVFEKDGEMVYFATLPYPTEFRMKEKFIENETYEDKVKRYIEKSMINCGDLPVVLLAHVFMLGGKSTDGERPIDLGGVRILPPSVIPENCVYTALGHLHKRQVVSKERNIIYSGSILQYSFDESGAEKSVTVFDINNGAVQNLEVVKLTGYKELFRIKTNSLAETEEKLATMNGYVEATVTLDKPCGDEVKEFLSKYPTVSLKLNFTSSERVVLGRKTLGEIELFKEFYKAQYSAEPSDEVLNLYSRIMNEIGVEDET